MTGDCTCSTFRVLLGWVLDTVNMILSLPLHQENRFKEILAGIPSGQKQIGVEKRHRVVGELGSMDIPLPGDRGIFSHIKEALCYLDGKTVALNRGVHQALTDFRWLA